MGVRCSGREALFTTGGVIFAECLLHSAKAALHSVKPLSSATLGKEAPSNPLPVKAALPSAVRALGKDLTPSAEGRRRLIFLNSLPSATAPALGKEICFFKPLCRVPQHRHSAKGVFYF